MLFYRQTTEARAPDRLAQFHRLLNLISPPLRGHEPLQSLCVGSTSTCDGLESQLPDVRLFSPLMFWWVSDSTASPLVLSSVLSSGTVLNLVIHLLMPCAPCALVLFACCTLDIVIGFDMLFHVIN